MVSFKLGKKKKKDFFVKRRGKYLPLAINSEVNICFSIYLNSEPKKY